MVWAIIIIALIPFFSCEVATVWRNPGNEVKELYLRDVILKLNNWLFNSQAALPCLSNKAHVKAKTTKTALVDWSVDLLFKLTVYWAKPFFRTGVHNYYHTVHNWTGATLFYIECSYWARTSWCRELPCVIMDIIQPLIIRIIDIKGYLCQN